MSRHPVHWKLLLVFAAAILFYFANRAAYKGYFSDDDFDSLIGSVFANNATYYHALVSLKLDPYKFRAFGGLYYRLMGRAFELHYAPYVAALQILHALNV